MLASDWCWWTSLAFISSESYQNQIKNFSCEKSDVRSNGKESHFCINSSSVNKLTMRKLNVFLLSFTILGLLGLFDCSEVISGREMAKKIKDAVLLYSKLINADYLKHLLIHPFHRLNKKHLLHRHRKHPNRPKGGPNNSSKRKTKSSRLTVNSN